MDTGLTIQGENNHIEMIGNPLAAISSQDPIGDRFEMGSKAYLRGLPAGILYCKEDHIPGVKRLPAKEANI